MVSFMRHNHWTCPDEGRKSACRQEIIFYSGHIYVEFNSLPCFHLGISHQLAIATRV